jgi:catechol-2,3-dioxygenase
MSPVIRLGHAGLWVDDLETMRDFYTRVLGLQITDEDPDEEMVFLSSRPEVEHHELVLARGRRGGPDVRVVHQISWRLEHLADVRDFHVRLRAEGVRVQQEVTHGNALGIYFYDPEGNRNEVYWATGVQVPQPFRKTIDLLLSEDQIMARSRELVAEGGPRYQPVRDL